jgi:hypothetical protein
LENNQPICKITAFFCFTFLSLGKKSKFPPPATNYFFPLFLALCLLRARAARFFADCGLEDGALRLGSWKETTFLGLARSSISMGEPLKSKALRRVFFKKVR